MATQQADLTFAVVGSSQTEMKIDPNIAANPAYEAVKCDQEDHTYDVVSGGGGFKIKEGQLTYKTLNFFLAISIRND